ncbi:MAG: P-loop NTPase, partial [Ferrovum sp.]|nr:P-loop NTPase [Ferrovum sp.]
MSIIEKAAGKLEQRTAAPAVPELKGLDLVQESAPVPPDGVPRPLPPSEDPFSEAPAEQKTAEASTPLFSKIDLERLRHLNIVTPSGEYSLTAEEFRMIKRPLLNNAFSGEKKLKNSNLIMVTSALPGDGKSFCALNLAISIAMEMDRTVLLVDADVSKPSQMKLLGIQAELGLLDL